MIHRNLAHPTRVQTRAGPADPARCRTRQRCRSNHRLVTHRSLPLQRTFAALAGARPIPASSGRVVRHRLNRGGDRKLNRALHTIANTLARLSRTAAYIQGRRAEGKSDGKIRRILKRYIARELYRALNKAAMAS